MTQRRPALVSSRATRAVIGSTLFFALVAIVLAALLIRDNYRSTLANSEGQALRFVAGAQAACLLYTSPSPRD